MDEESPEPRGPRSEREPMCISGEGSGWLLLQCWACCAPRAISTQLSPAFATLKNVVENESRFLPCGFDFEWLVAVDPRNQVAYGFLNLVPV